MMSAFIILTAFDTSKCIHKIQRFEKSFSLHRITNDVNGNLFVIYTHCFEMIIINISTKIIDIIFFLPVLLFV